MNVMMVKLMKYDCDVMMEYWTYSAIDSSLNHQATELNVFIIAFEICGY